MSSSAYKAVAGRSVAQWMASHYRLVGNQTSRAAARLWSEASLNRSLPWSGRWDAQLPGAAAPGLSFCLPSCSRCHRRL